MRIEALTRRWAAGWAHTRGLETGEVAGWPLLYVGSASRATEIVCAEPDEGTWTALLERLVGEPGTMLSVVSVRPGRYLEKLPAGVRVDRDDQTLMLRRHGTFGRPSPQVVDVTEYRIDREDDGDRTRIQLVSGDRVAAEGTVGLFGRDCVYDMVETTPGFRRRGLAGWVMNELAREVTRRGATTGLLAATAEGAGLYRTLGWSDVALIRSLRGE